MKSKHLLFFSIMAFITLIPLRIKAGSVGYITADGVSFKSEPNYGGKNILNTLDTGDKVTLENSNIVASTTAKCKKGFYYVNYYWESYNQKNYKGYVCGDYINFNIDINKYSDLSSFPDTYKEKLTLLKDIHPNWKFTAYNTNLNWNDATTAESVVGISYIQSNNPIYLSLDPGSYDASTNTYIQKEAGGWYAANKATVAYYMDPRNFLDEVNIYMFENLSYNSSYQTKDVVQNIFKGTKLSDYTNAYIEAATYNGNSVSPVSLAARSRQEVVLSDGSLSGSANGSSGYYNFYNLGAFSSCKNPIECAINFASGYGGEYTSYNRPWKTPEAAIKNGANYLANGYINQKQYTLYFQRFNVTSNSYGNYSHQYMTNLQASVSEARSTYKAYSSIDGLTNSTIEFIIPIYNNMPDSVSLPTSVNEEQKNNNQTTTNTDLTTIIKNAGYTSDNSYIYNIQVGTKAQDFINAIKNNKGNISINNGTSSNPNYISGSEQIGTNDAITISNGSNTVTYRAIVYGDANGDGKISAVDYVKIKNYIMGSSSLSGAYKAAADVNRDGKISAVDYVNVKNYIMGNNSTLR